MEKKQPRFLTEKEAAALIGIPPMSLFHLRRRSPDAKIPIPFIRLGTRIRYEEEPLLAWLRAHEVKGGDSVQAGRRRLRAAKEPRTAPVNRGGRPKKVQPAAAPAVKKRGPGRPPKVALAPVVEKRGPGRPPKAAAPGAEVIAMPKRRGPGRPKKLNQAMAASTLKKRKTTKK